MKTIYLLANLMLLTVAATLRLNAQQSATPPTFRFEIFHLPGGELGNHVQSIAQDSAGFMWFGSQYGLHRWDGYRFKTFLTNTLDSGAISSNYVEYIYVSKDGSLWLGTWGGGLNHFDPKTQRFTQYLHDPLNPASLSNNYVTQVLEDKDGYMWVSTLYGLNRLDRKTGVFRRFNHNAADPKSLSDDRCRVIYLDRAGTLWVGTGWPWDNGQGGGLNRYDSRSGTFTRYLHDSSDPNSLINDAVAYIGEDSRGNFWVGTAGDGLHLMNRKTGRFTRLSNKRHDSDEELCAPYVRRYSDWHTRFVFEDRERKLWVGSWRGGIKYHDPETGYTKHFEDNDDEYSSVPDNYAWMMFQSKDGMLWSSTAGPGAQVFKIIREKSIFKHANLGSGDAVQTICGSNAGDLWMGTVKGGLLQVDGEHFEGCRFFDDPQKSVPFKMDLRVDDAHATVFGKVGKIVEDRSGDLWMGKWLVPSGLMRFSPATGEIKTYWHKPENSGSISSNTISDILEDKKGKMWVATANGALNRYDPHADAFKQYNLIGASDKKEPEIKEEYFFCKLYLARDGAIWMAGSGGNKDVTPLTLVRFDPEDESIQKYDLRRAPYQFEWVNGLEEDREGNIWVNTDFNLWKLNPTTKVTTSYSAEFLGTTFLHGMIFDDFGRLWLAGDGLVMFNPADGTSFSYRSASGIKTLPFHRQSVYKDERGWIYFGGNGGVLYFDPKEIGLRRSGAAPEVLITEFSLFDNFASPDGDREPMYRNIWDIPEIRLTHDQDIFTFRFAALDFLYPEGNRHKFILEGYDREWRYAGLEPVASYAKVPPGTYTFRVRAANQNGIWGPEKTIRVIISPPWWATWWAYLLYGSLALAIMYAFYRVQLDRRLEQAEAERLRELDTVKSRLYTNITHEFRTPLTVILGMAQQVENELGKMSSEGVGTADRQFMTSGLSLIRRNGHNLLSLVNQMLDLAKLESGKMQVNMQQGDVVNYLRYLVESFHSYAESKGVRVHFLSDEDAFTMDYDPEKLQQVVVNLLSNAVKFTPANGHVYVDVRFEKSGDRRGINAAEENIVIRVRDTGIGISEEQLPHIFDRFYQGDDSQTRQNEGSGIGLALTMELVRLMDGDISVKSQPGHGAEFAVALSIHRNAPEQKTAMPLNVIEAGEALPEKGDEKKNVLSPVPEGPVSAPLILVVEDNPDVVAYLASCLPQYRLLVGKDGGEGIEIARESVPDLIITDVMMPHKDGYEVCRTLRSDERTSHIPIIMLTAKADMESKLEGLEKGADAYLAKPFLKEELLVRIRKLLEMRSHLQQHYLTSAGLTEEMETMRDLPQVPALEDQFVKKVRQVVEAHLDRGDFDVERLCREMAMSHSQLHRKLSALTGLSATRFIRYVRLNKAKELLRDPVLSITSIAYDTGFNDPGYFSRVFKQEFGATPQEWRELQEPELV
ncbi:MAG: helix-turn-helix domain-containing protein [Lewinellaceae bacterium]|nr:helix-turn-helix domain-containing protein [Lewinellaceae bacterium]